MKLLIATNNSGKKEEFQKILSQINVELVFPQDVGLGELLVAETGQTFKANALLKAQQFAERAGMIAVADDSGLEVDFLDGNPGVQSKRFAPGTDKDRNEYLLSLLEGVKNKADRKARFRTVLCLFDPQSKEVNYFEGTYEGRISFEARGEEGFGYDPVFIPEGMDKTSAELGVEYKNQNSHRYKAIVKLANYLEKQS